ncbi:MAG: RNA polymerase sigma-70 factor [Bacteroidales bacterium]|jgi:RNA polymerase sigma-70 factor (ECF subfamily)|nr:RNA polymerase sigma-70 factor [Bacteroidales bacterium]
MKEGDIKVFRDIYREYASMLQAFAEKFTDRETSRDLVQDVFMQLWVNRESVYIRESLRAYLYGAVRNRCINYLEHLKLKTDYGEREKIDLQIREAVYLCSPEQLLIEREQLDRVCREVEKLPKKSRESFKKAYFEDKKAAEIAAELHLSVRTVETQIYKALKTLREIFYPIGKETHKNDV